MKALVLAAGVGARVRPISNFVPKPLFPLLDRPLILWTFETLKNLSAQSAIVNLHHMGEQIQKVLGSQKNGIEITYSHEPELLGTGGAIKKIKTQLEISKNLLVINSDCIFFGTLKGLVESHKRYNPLATLAVAEDPNQTYTPLYADKDGTVVGIGKDAPKTFRRFMFLGAHMVSAEALDVFPKEKVFGIMRGAYIPALESRSFKIWRYKGAWLDCGTNALYLTASNFLLDNPKLWQKDITSKIKVSDSGIFTSSGATINSGSVLTPPVFIGEGAQIEDSRIGPYVVVGKGSIVKRARLKSGIVWQETSIQGKKLENFIATPFVTVKLEA